ncbi:MAG: pyroglutamyl-peptidase I [Planctomycetota bacterium]|nr:pyroglutamyl-peptidase I [Planctomycetota bacterium]
MFLVCGFEPFGGMRRNPSGEAAQAVAAQAIQALDGVEAAVLPVDYGRLGPALDTLLARPWRGVLLLGVRDPKQLLWADPHRSVFAVERVAINYRNPGRPDNTGAAPTELELVPGGPAAYFATLDPLLLVARLKQEGLPAQASLSAGAYLCNASFYLALAALRPRGVPCIFVHVPPTPDMGVKGASLEFEELCRGVRVALDHVKAVST